MPPLVQSGGCTELVQLKAAELLLQLINATHARLAVKTAVVWMLLAHVLPKRGIVLYMRHAVSVTLGILVQTGLQDQR